MPRRNKTSQHIPMKPFVGSSSSCQQKRRYHTEKEALRAADTQMLTDYKLELDVYKCPSCRGWHLTRRPATGTNKY